MGRFLGTIYLSLGFLFVFSGCGGVKPPSQLPPAKVAEAPPELDQETPSEQISTSPIVDNRTENVETAPSVPPAVTRTETIPPAEPNVPDEEDAGPTPATKPDITTPQEPIDGTQAEEMAPVGPNQPEEEQLRVEQAEDVPPAILEGQTAVPTPSQADEEGPEVPALHTEGYADILQEYVRDDGRIDYESLRRQRLRLKHLLGEPDELDGDVYAKWSEAEKLAFWINTYNLKMLDVIVRNYPIESSWWLRLTWPPSDIRHIDGIWSNYRFIVMDEEFTLGEVERRIFRKTFGDPRVYLAILYAARSGPDLCRQPYQGPTLDRQLDEQVRGFLASDKGFRIDRGAAVVHLSALFKPGWRGKEFIGRYGTEKKFKNHPPETRAVLNFLIPYLSQDDVYYLEVENYTLAYMNFDWRLNDTGKGY